jgi:hypothetical protein
MLILLHSSFTTLSESQTLTRRPSKGAINKRKFGTKIKKVHPP